MKKFASLLFALTTVALVAQSVRPGERFTYAAAYNMSGLLTPIAEVQMNTETVKTAKSSYLHLVCKATTYSKWDSFFKIRDVYEAYVDPKTFRPKLYKRDVFEGKYTKKEKYLFKNAAMVSIASRNNAPETRRTLSIGASAQDVVTVLYQLRNVDFSAFRPGQIATFNVIFDEKEMSVAAKYLGRETVDAGNLGKRTCYKISIAAKTDALRGADKNLIWLTADSRKIPALVQFSIPVGTGQLRLTHATGL